MSTNSPNGPEHRDEYPDDAAELGGGAVSDVDPLEGPEDPGTVDPFQDSEYLATHLPDDAEALPGTGSDEAGTDAPSEDEERFDAG